LTLSGSASAEAAGLIAPRGAAAVLGEWGRRDVHRLVVIVPAQEVLGDHLEHNVIESEREKQNRNKKRATAHRTRA
jgi:hypothetical protein